MEFKQLEMFAAVVDAGSVHRGAERVFRTAPAVSVALRKLEEEMDGPLFDRSERDHHRLTAAGKLLYSYAVRILAMRSEAAASIKDLGKGRRGNLRLGMHDSISLYLLPSLMHTFNEAQPGVKTEVVCGNSERLLTALDNRTIELALMGDAPEKPFERHLVMQDELVLITSPRHRLAALKQVHVRDLAGEFLILQGTKSLLRARIVRALQESDTPFNVCVENIAIECIKGMVAQDIGVGFVPLLCVSEAAAQGKLVTIRVEGVPSEWNLSLVHRKSDSLSPAARAFMNISLAITQPNADDSENALGHRTEEAQRRVNQRQSLPIHSRTAIHC